MLSFMFLYDQTDRGKCSAPPISQQTTNLKCLKMCALNSNRQI